MREKRLDVIALYLSLVLSALAVFVAALAHFVGLDFLAGALMPLLIMAALSWVLYVLVRSLEQGTDFGPIVSGLGPEGVILQRATRSAWGRDLQSAAGQHFVAGEVHFQGGRYQEAAEAFRHSVEARDSLATDLNLGAALLNVADFAGAKEVLELGFWQAQRQNSREYEAAFQLNLGVLNARQGRLAEALTAYGEARRHFELLGDERGLGDALINIGQAQVHLGQSDMALVSGERALRVHQRTGSGLGRAGALSCLGYACFCRDEIAQALEYLLESLEIHEGLGNVLGQGHVLTHVGNLHFKQDELDEALRAYERAFELHGKAADRLGEASALVNVANVHFRKGELDAALDNYDQAFKIHEQAGNIMGQARALTNIGSLLGRQGKLRAALETLNRARGFYLQVGGDSRGLGAVEKLIARLEDQAEEDGSRSD